MSRWLHILSLLAYFKYSMHRRNQFDDITRGRMISKLYERSSLINVTEEFGVTYNVDFR